MSTWNFDVLTRIDLRNTAMTGSLDWVAAGDANPNLKQIYLQGTSTSPCQYTSDLTRFSRFVMMEYLLVRSCPGVTGSVTDWSSMVRARILYLDGSTNLVGDVTGWSALTSAYIIALHENPGIRGDISNWDGADIE